MKNELEPREVDSSFSSSRRFNETLAGREKETVEIAQNIIQKASSPLLLSHHGLVLTPRTWSDETRHALAKIVTASRNGLQKVATYLAVSDDEIASGVRRNMLGGRHFDIFEETLKKEVSNGVVDKLFEVGRADILNGGAVEVNAACLDAPADFHDLSIFHVKLQNELQKNGVNAGLVSPPELSIAHLVVQTMVNQARFTNRHRGQRPVLAWIGTASEIYGGRDNGGYWPREHRLKQIAEEYLLDLGFDAEFRLIPVEQLNDPGLVSKIGSAYRNLLPEDMEIQSSESIKGLSELSTSGRLVGSLTAELLTNKAAMAIISSPELSQKAGIRQSEWEYFSQAFPPTAFLSGYYIYVNGERRPIDEVIDKKREQYYFKLSNGEEGKGVFSGKEMTHDQLKHLMELSKKDPYSVIMQRELRHIPFEAAVIDLSRNELDILDGFTDAGTHYQMNQGILGNPTSNIVMTRFTPSNNGVSISNSGKDGVFRPVTTVINKHK